MIQPDICRFPSLNFYDGKLLNDVQMSSKSAPFHETEALGPYVFFDVIDEQKLHGNCSLQSLFSCCSKWCACDCKWWHFQLWTYCQGFDFGMLLFFHVGNRIFPVLKHNLYVTVTRWHVDTCELSFCSYWFKSWGTDVVFSRCLK